MPRNGSGTYTIPNTFVSGATAVAEDVNTNFTDIASAMTGSLAIDGQSAMTGQLKALAGTLSAPGIAYNGDLDTGIYRSTTNTQVLVAGGVAGITHTDTAITIALPTTINANSTVNGALSIGSTLGVTGTATFSGAAVFASTVSGVFPAGIMAPYAGASAPTGWLLCDGSAISRTTYAALFAVIGTTYGAGDGSTTFNVPDLKGRAPIGRDNMGGTAANRITSGVSGIVGTTLGAAGGDERLHQHTHTVTDPGHTHPTSKTNLSGQVANGGGSSGNTINISTPTVATDSATTGITIANAGAGSSQNVQPSLVVNYIIKT